METMEDTEICSHVGSNSLDGIDETEFDLPPSLKNRMFQHQIEGVAWLQQKHKLRTGAILGDDMGLG